MAQHIKLHHSRLGLMCTLLLLNVGLLSGRSVEFVFSGDGCECPRELPFEIGIPFIRPPFPPMTKAHAYKVEVPSIQEAKMEYSLDFQIEQPQPPVPPVPLGGAELTARVDRIQVPKPDCQHFPSRACSCGTTPSSCGMRPCSCGVNPCSCGYKPCSCGSSPCSCGLQQQNLPFLKPYPFADGHFPGAKYHVPVNYLSSRVNRDLRGNNFSSRKNLKLFKAKGKTNYKKNNHVKKRLNKREVSDINEHLDILSKTDAKNLDLRIPEILQLMPEFMSSNFERGKCFDCCSSEFKQNLQRANDHDCTCNIDINPVDLIPNFYEYIQGCPVSYQPRAKDSVKFKQDKYVYDRLGHKYKENKGRLKLVPPTKQSKDPNLGSAQQGHNSNNMDDLIREIVYSHPDFLAASDHGDGILTPSVQVQNQESMAFLRKLIEGRLSKLIKKMSKDNFENDYNYEDSSFERPYRSANPTDDFLDVQLETLLNDDSNESNIDTNQETVLKTLKGHDIHLVKLEKDGQTLQILASQDNNDRNEMNGE